MVSDDANGGVAVCCAKGMISCRADSYEAIPRGAASAVATREQQPAARRHGVSRAARWISRAACRCGRQMLLQCEYQYKYAYGREHLFRITSAVRVRYGRVRY